MEKFIEIIGKIHKDKLEHFFVATIVAFVFINLFGFNGYVISLVGFVLKEVIFDKILGWGCMSFGDFIYGAIPATLILITKYYETIFN